MLWWYVIAHYCFDTSWYPCINYVRTLRHCTNTHTHAKLKEMPQTRAGGYRPGALFPAVAHLAHCLASRSSPCLRVRISSSCCPRATSCFHPPGLLPSCLHLALLLATASPPPSLNPAGLLSANDRLEIVSLLYSTEERKKKINKKIRPPPPVRKPCKQISDSLSTSNSISRDLLQWPTLPAKLASGIRAPWLIAFWLESSPH